MSRTKKSRKPATAPKAKPKLSKKELSQAEKRTKKLTGKKPGNRQLEAQKKPKKSTTPSHKDPRIGSKKPIVLVKETEVKKVAQVVQTEMDIAPIHFTENESLIDEILVDEIIIDEDALTAELTAIEQDDKLHVISSKAESEVSEEEIVYFNDKMERHQELCLILGIEYGEQDDEQVAEPDKLDSNGFINDLNDDLSKE